MPGPVTWRSEPHGGKIPLVYTMPWQDELARFAMRVENKKPTNMPVAAQVGYFLGVAAGQLSATFNAIPGVADFSTGYIIGKVRGKTKHLDNAQVEEMRSSFQF